ncbi:MAG: metabolite traffic protein EboE [Planctomycetota bacterium]|jgi:hypothetical protein
MRDALGPGTTLGYCTNVHAGVSLDETKSNLQHDALAVKAIVSPNEPMGVGLWLSADASRTLIEEDGLARFRDWLEERGLFVFTINGFPQSDFHQPVVKHAVYRPDWTETARERYTRDLLRILAALLPEHGEGSISTLPIGWPAGGGDDDRMKRAAARLRSSIEEARHIEHESGRLIHIDLEPEPGCLLQRSTDVARFFSDCLPGGDEGDTMRRYLRVCHDVCHAAVMFEEQREMFDRYDAAGIRVGKVQLSSAVRVHLRGRGRPDQVEVLAELSRFVEDRYLHQTVVRRGPEHEFFEDLPDALDACAHLDRIGEEWRVHFHVPVFLEAAGLLGTTRDMIGECIDLLRGREVRNWEVETYAWSVLPESLRGESLADGIARELLWVKDRAQAGQTT